jgi:putative FmdB family regulatory protein
MPDYEYRCNDCQRRVTLFYKTYAEYDAAMHTCPYCQSTDLTRLISRVAVARSEESRMEALADPSSFGDLDSDDPREMGRFMRKMGQEMGEDMRPEFNEVVERLESGESPDAIEESMPDLGDDTFD